MTFCVKLSDVFNILCYKPATMIFKRLFFISVLALSLNFVSQSAVFAQAVEERIADNHFAVSIVPWKSDRDQLGIDLFEKSKSSFISIFHTGLKIPFENLLLNLKWNSPFSVYEAEIKKFTNKMVSKQDPELHIHIYSHGYICSDDSETGIITENNEMISHESISETIFNILDDFKLKAGKELTLTVYVESCHGGGLIDAIEKKKRATDRINIFSAATTTEKAINFLGVSLFKGTIQLILSFNKRMQRFEKQGALDFNMQDAPMFIELAIGDNPHDVYSTYQTVSKELSKETLLELISSKNTGDLTSQIFSTLVKKSAGEYSFLKKLLLEIPDPIPKETSIGIQHDTTEEEKALEEIIGTREVSEFLYLDPEFRDKFAKKYLTSKSQLVRSAAFNEIILLGPLAYPYKNLIKNVIAMQPDSELYAFRWRENLQDYYTKYFGFNYLGDELSLIPDFSLVLTTSLFSSDSEVKESAFKYFRKNYKTLFERISFSTADSIRLYLALDVNEPAFKTVDGYLQAAFQLDLNIPVELSLEEKNVFFQELEKKQKPLLLSMLPKIDGEDLLSHKALLVVRLNTAENKQTQLAFVKAIRHANSFIEKGFQGAVPTLVRVLEKVVTPDSEDLAIEVLTTIQEIGYRSKFVEAALDQIVENKNIQESIREKAKETKRSLE